MKKLLQSIILSFVAVVGFSLAAAPVYAAEEDAGAGSGSGSGSSCSSPVDCIRQGSDDVGGDAGGMTLEEGITNIVNILLFVLGAIAVIMIIIGGIRYATSNGDASSTKAAKDTILYAVIGLVVAILSYAIVNFVIDAFAGNS